MEGGTFEIAAYDDCFNAAGGWTAPVSAAGESNFSAHEDSFITVNGGTITVVSDGDCLDSNGDLTVNGGTLDLTCNGNGNTALDCSGSYTQQQRGGDHQRRLRVRSRRHGRRTLRWEAGSSDPGNACLLSGI